MSNDPTGEPNETNPGSDNASDEPVRTSSGDAAAAAPARVTSALSEVQRLLAGHTDRSEEMRILDIFRSATQADLNHILANLNLHEAIKDIDDRLVGPDNRTALYQLLSRDRLADITIANRAALIMAVQHGITGMNAERFVCDIFLGTQGKNLTTLKCAIDDGDDVYDLHKLLFDDIDDAGIRNAIVSHIQHEGASNPSGQVKVLSDIDDTFYANLKESRYPKGTVYPGVRSFYRELDKGTGTTEDRRGDLTFLTARPEDEAHLIESKTLAMLKSNGVTNATVLGGDFMHLIGNENIAAGKFSKFEEFHSLYPEYGFVFIGDSGQGDAIFGERMMAQHPGSAKAVFIHDVVNTPAEKRAELAQKNVFFFDTYAGAALVAFGMGLLREQGLARVAQSAVDEFSTMEFASAEQKAARLDDLRKDIERVNAQLDLKVTLP